MKLRRPMEKLAGCCWLPRFIDKARHHLAGTLDPEFIVPFCHPLATDGVFLEHFQTTKEAMLHVIQTSAGDDKPIVEWFSRRPQSSPERIDEWNALAPNLGKPGYPVHRGFLWALKHYHAGSLPDPRVVSVFTAIAWDEGFINDL